MDLQTPSDVGRPKPNLQCHMASQQRQASCCCPSAKSSPLGAPLKSCCRTASQAHILSLYMAGSWHSWGDFASAANSGAAAGDRAAQDSPAAWAGTYWHTGDEPPSTRGEADGHGDLSLLILPPREPGCGGSEGGHCQQGLETLNLTHDASTSPVLATAAGTAQMWSCEQRFTPTAHNTALCSRDNVGGDQKLLLTWLFPRLTVLHYSVCNEIWLSKKGQNNPPNSQRGSWHISTPPCLPPPPSWLLHMTAPPDFSAQSASKPAESYANFPITNLSGHQPCESLFPLPRPALPIEAMQTVPSAQRGCVQPSRWSYATFDGAARQQSVGN